jgi:transmembrane sensor
MRAYLEVTALWSETAEVNRDRRWAIDDLIRQAAQETDNVVSLEGSNTTLEGGRVRTTRRLRVRMLSAAASILILTIAGVAGWYSQRGTYSTDIGEQRSLILADGSTVQLNSRSKVRVRLSEHERRVELVRGQALFQVARNPARPFIVVSSDTRVRAVGTQFDVYQKRQGTVVTVVEGKVAVFERMQPTHSALQPPNNGAVTQSGAARQPIYVSAGEQLALTGASPHVAKAVNPAVATAWTQRQLVFESTPLADVAEEFNRYNERQLVIRDPALQEFQIDGVFSSTDPSSLVRFLSARADVKVIETDAAFVIEHR